MSHTPFRPHIEALEDRLALSGNWIVNGGFEAGSGGWSVGGGLSPSVSTLQHHSGSHSLLLGSANPFNGDSWAYQAVAIPANAASATLSFWYRSVAPDTLTYDWQDAQVQDASGKVLVNIFRQEQTTSGWVQKTVDLTPYRGQTLRVYFNAHDDNYSGDASYMWVDDVSLNVTIPPAHVVNGGFEAGSGGWSVGGGLSPSVSTLQHHSGSHSLLLGSANPFNGDSWAYQAVAIPANAASATLSFWYRSVAPDTLTYDWQDAQVQDASGKVLVNIFRQEQTTSGWVQKTVDLTPYRGQTLRVYFNAHDDNYSGDASYMWVDDVSLRVK